MRRFRSSATSALFLMLSTLVSLAASGYKPVTKYDPGRKPENDLLQAEAEVAQRHDLVQAAQLLNAVQAVPAGRPDSLRHEQAKVVVVPQHARRHLAEPGELPDSQHALLIRPDTVRRSSAPHWKSELGFILSKARERAWDRRPRMPAFGRLTRTLVCVR